MFGLGGAISSLPYIAAVVAGLLLVNWAVENPLVRENARQGYVSIAEKAALEAELTEANRQRAAAVALEQQWSARVESLQKESKEQDAALEVATYEYEAKLDDAKRACRKLDADDFKLLKHR